MKRFCEFIRLVSDLYLSRTFWVCSLLLGVPSWSQQHHQSAGVDSFKGDLAFSCQQQQQGFSMELRMSSLGEAVLDLTQTDGKKLRCPYVVSFAKDTRERGKVEMVELVLQNSPSAKGDCGDGDKIFPSMSVDLVFSGKQLDRTLIRWISQSENAFCQNTKYDDLALKQLVRDVTKIKAK